ncbi:dynein regulatory complex protein 1 [Strongylocentrotus purpuratus]|uniref:Dynein regulatory complex protein 1 n=1 Tax=Strongylocentrotus purpuratus TaxID=7668 RepID=A0A7M7N4J1_STRPU|nr:dynein regulatory complex protein 1 [Strongylocentrotus purpuratus]
MSSHDEEEDTGPSVDSTDPEERIAARRLRITKRVEAARREKLGEDPGAKKKEDKEEASKSRKQVEESRQRLTKLQSHGTELVTNVRVAADSREAQRRAEEEETQRQRDEKLEAEAKAGMERFEEITKRWEQANGRDIPQELHDILMQQKALCDAMIDEKNKLINDFQMELKSQDDQYVKDLKKEAEDIDLMIERMEEQVKNLMKAYRDELKQIERAFETEREELLDNNKRKWDQAMGGRRDQELDYMHQREKRVEEYEQQIQHLRIQDAEEYNMVKIKLETDVQVLEQQLQQMKATYQLNQEKLEYNFQVLKKRDEENTITKSQQKRKITRLQDVLNNLKVKLAKQEKQYKEENQGLADDYKRITEQFKELQKKSKHFQSTDTKKFHDIWLMNEEEARELSAKLMEQDRIVSEQQLGLPWQPPADHSFMENVGPLTTEKSKKKPVSAHEVLMEVMSDGSYMEEGSVQESERGDGGEEGSPRERPEGDEEEAARRLSVQTVKQILELICDESGFLVEAKLNKLLAPLEKDERCLMKLDAIFAALGIETEEDIHKLAGYFLQAVHGKDHDQVPEGGEEIAQGTEDQPGSQEIAAQDSVDAEVAVITGQGQDQSETGSVRSTKSNVLELIHPNDALSAMRMFVEENRKPTKEKVKYQTFRIISGEDRDSSEDADYWKKFPSVISEKQGKVWTALIDGFEKYSDTLHERAKLITETDGLRQQNAELRMLLHQYINSRVNQELEIPPTRILNLEVPQ